MTADEIGALPAVVNLPAAALALGLGRSAAYQLVRVGDWPTPVLRLGRLIRVPSAPLLELFGLASPDSRCRIKALTAADPLVADPQEQQHRDCDSPVVEGHHFALVPEWLINADIGDCAFRLYAVLLRYGQSSGNRMLSRATLAERLRKRSVDTVDQP